MMHDLLQLGGAAARVETALYVEWHRVEATYKRDTSKMCIDEATPIYYITAKTLSSTPTSSVV